MAVKSNTKALREAIKIVGSQEKLAEKLGITQGAVSHWFNKNKGVAPPVEYVPAIEEATNGVVTRFDLRPDFFKGGKSDNSTKDMASPV